MGKRKKEVLFCDHCGEEFDEDHWGEPLVYKSYTHLPFNVSSANKGESAVLCELCAQDLDYFHSRSENSLTAEEILDREEDLRSRADKDP